MKKKQLIISLSLALTVLFSILFQSIHTYEHFIKQFLQTECHHKHNGTAAQITHQHHSFDTCKVCHFTFGTYVAPKSFAYKLLSNYKEVPYFYKTAKGILSFSGSLYSHRGPPLV
jgi:hypothetical protein